MTTTLSAKGQIVIPRDIRLKLGLHSGDDFLVLSSASGEILLRPLRPGARRSLTDALRLFHGLELERADEPIRNVAL